MCLAAIAIGQSARFPWVLLANRDEFFDRPTDALAWWHPRPDGPPVLSGRDRFAGGTWLGLSETGQLALVTNVREPDRVLARAPSRGELVLQWLLGDHDEAALRAKLAVPRNGFNLLTADLSAAPPAAAGPAVAWWLSNRPRDAHHALGSGVYGVSNAALDTPWPKVLKIKSRLRAALIAASSVTDLTAAGFTALSDRAEAVDALLPHTGVPLARERRLSPAFVSTGEAAERAYGTRCSTLVIAECHAGQRVVHVIERSFDAGGAVTGEVSMQLQSGR
jgi:uncharacterized protein with NRDE domain